MIYAISTTISRLKCLVAVGETTHTGHHAEHVVVGGIDADLGGLGSGNGGVGQNKEQGGVVNAREVARARWLVLLRAQSEGVHVDTSVGVAGVVLVGLDEVEVGTLALGEAVLTVELKLGGHNGVLTPAVEVQSGLSKHEGAGIRHTRVHDTLKAEVGARVSTIGVGGCVPVVVWV